MPRSVLPNSLLILLSCLLLMCACAPTGIYHTVQPGQTLYRIAKTYEIDEARLASINQIKDPSQLKAKQRLYIPGVSQVRKVPVTALTDNGNTSPVVAATPQAIKTNTRPAAQQPAKPSVKPPVKPTAKPTANKPVISAAPRSGKPVKGTFVWPLRGKILNQFGKNGKSVYKGIEIGVPQGTPVVAAASGKVIYSGSAISGYGNLVILEHSDSFFSVYGFNQKTLVKMNDHVGQGEKIALSGVPPSGQSARLHFEIRQGKSAVNPILYLP